MFSVMGLCVVCRYLEPDGLCNYLRFHYDVCQVGNVTMAGSNHATDPLASNVYDDSQSSLQQILSKIGNVVFKNGIRTTEFFKDHDKLNSGVITQNQVCTRWLACKYGLGSIYNSVITLSLSDSVKSVNFINLLYKLV